MATTAEIERVEAKIIAQKGAKSCDKYDYLTAVGCGVVAGLVDSFFVGMPGESKLGGWTDAQVDKAVMNFAKICGWTPHAGKENSVSSAIGFLERNFRVNYDQKNSVEAGTPFKMSPSNHHMKSLAHSPDIVGLFFSILNQFTGTATYLDNGRFITIQTDTYELQGNDFISKLFCGTVNWLGHLMSDVAGSSGGRGKNNGGRGSGIVIPFYELFGLCNFGSFQVGKDRNTLAILATKAFQKGYDARWGLTMAIPVVLCDLSIRFIWSVRRYFGDKKPLQECIPSEKYPDLRMISEKDIPKEFVKRNQQKVEDVIPLPENQLLVFFRDGCVKKHDLVQLASTDKRFAPVLQNENTFRAVNVETDGYGICWGENLCIECGKLYAAGKKVPLSMEEFKCFVRERVVDSAEAAEELACSKQNVDDLAKRGKLHPIKEGAKYRLFLKSEVMQRKWK